MHTIPQPPALGSFETEKQVRDLPAVQAVYTSAQAAYAVSPGAGKMTPPNAAMLTGACEAAGVELGAFDRRIIAWLAGYEPETCAVVADLITRAAAGRTAADVAARLLAVRAVVDRVLGSERGDRQMALEEIGRIAGGSKL